MHLEVITQNFLQSTVFGICSPHAVPLGAMGMLIKKLNAPMSAQVVYATDISSR